MFKKIITLLNFFVFAGAANAEFLEYKPMPMFGQCTETAPYVLMLETEYGEQAVLEGNGFIQLFGRDPATEMNSIANGYMTISTNFDTGTFTVSITFADGMSCLLIDGTEFVPFGSQLDN